MKNLIQKIKNFKKNWPDIKFFLRILWTRYVLESRHYFYSQKVSISYFAKKDSRAFSEIMKRARYEAAEFTKKISPFYIPCEDLFTDPLPKIGDHDDYLIIQEYRKT